MLGVEGGASGGWLVTDLEQAISFATEAHRGQTDKLGATAYVAELRAARGENT